jgi:hypothetical protein
VQQERCGEAAAGLTQHGEERTGQTGEHDNAQPGEPGRDRHRDQCQKQGPAGRHPETGSRKAGRKYGINSPIAYAQASATTAPAAARTPARKFPKPIFGSRKARRPADQE